MRTPMKLNGMLVAATLLITFGCNKQQLNPRPCKDRSGKTTEVANKSIHCSPWRDAADAYAAAADLNAVGACNTSTCDGTATYDYLHSTIVKDGSGSNWYFLGGNGVTIAEQNAIWSYAMSQAVANTPAGFSVFRIHNFNLISVGTMFVADYMRFDVTYIKCTSGGGGHN